MANIDDALKSLKKEESKEIIFVPAELVSEYKTKAVHDRETGPEDDSASTSSSDEISIHVQSPVNESLSSSALTAASSTQVSSPEDATAVEDLDADVDPSTQRRSRVRFRSRVRITSGLHHYRARERERARDLHPNSHARRLSAASSTTSLTSSPSSSISAPLRSPLTEENCTPGWGTLGTRVNLFAVSNRQAKAHAHGRGRRRSGGVADLAQPSSERTALLGTAPPDYDYDSADDRDSTYTQSDDKSVLYGYGYDEETLLSRQIDLVFGKWPGRLLNRQVSIVSSAFWLLHIPSPNCSCLLH